MESMRGGLIGRLSGITRIRGRLDFERMLGWGRSILEI